jgi:hypothetical protein
MVRTPTSREKCKLQVPANKVLGKKNIRAWNFGGGTLVIS